MSKSCWRSFIAAALTALVALGMQTPVAYAAPPANDSLSAAQVITAIPSRFQVDTREATTEPFETGFGYPCMGSRSVWYRIQPTSDVTARVITVNSDYNNLVGLFTGSPGALQPVACNDDIAVGAGVEARLVSGVNYYIAISSCCDTSSPIGGRAVLRLYESAPLTVSATMTGASAGDVSGSAVLSGSHRCSNIGVVSVTVVVRERLGGQVARGGNSFSALCSSKTRSWTMVVDAELALAFRPGPARVTMSWSATDGFTNTPGRTVTRTVVLTNGPDLRAPSHAGSAHARRSS